MKKTLHNFALFFHGSIEVSHVRRNFEFKLKFTRLSELN